MKKFLSVLLAVILAASFMTVAFAAEDEAVDVAPPSDLPVAVEEKADAMQEFGAAVAEADTDAVKGAIEDAFASAKQNIKNLTFSDILSLPSYIMDDIATSFFALLKVLGVDVDAIYEKLASSKIINWVANFYKGAPAKKTEAEVIPQTGSTGSIAVFATLSLAAAAAFVCYKKKEA